MLPKFENNAWRWAEFDLFTFRTCTQRASVSFSLSMPQLIVNASIMNVYTSDFSNKYLKRYAISL